MKKIRKSIAVLLIISILTGGGIFNVSSIMAFAADESIGQNADPFVVDSSDPYNPVYYDENGNKVDMNALRAELDGDTGNNPESQPTTYDARSYNLITNVKYQGNYGTCWAHATMACLEADAIKNSYYTKDNADFSEAHLAWFQKNPVDSSNSTSANDGSNNTIISNGHTGAFDRGGHVYPAIATLSRMEGIALESDFSYSEVKNYTQNLYSDSQRYNSGSGLMATSMVELKGQYEVKQWIKDHGAVFCAYYARNPINSNAAYYYKTVTINHAVTIVGWDDNYSVNNFDGGNRPAKNGAWLVKNSWDTDWGNNGYFWMSYETTPIQFFGFTVGKTEGIKNNYTYNGESADRFEVKVPSNWQTANVFEAKGNEKLTKISFYTAQRNLDVVVKVYKLEKNHLAPVSGDLVFTESKTYKNAGYHTVNLKNSVELAEGQLFSVVVEYSTASKRMIIFCENSKSDIAYVSEKGESWFGYDGDWIDTSKLDGGYGNNYINAITEESSGSTPAEEKEGRISASPSELTVETGESKAILAAYSPWKGTTGKYDFSFDFDDNYLSAKWEGYIDGKWTNGIGKLVVTGLKPGKSSVKFIMTDKSTGNVLDTASVTVTVKEKTAPVPSTKKPSIEIKGFKDEYIADYRSSFIFNAKVENMPADSKIVWVTFETLTVGEGETFSCGEQTESFTIQAQIVKGEEIIAESQTVTVYIRSGFFAWLIAFFRGLFGLLPVIEDGRIK